VKYTYLHTYLFFKKWKLFLSKKLLPSQIIYLAELNESTVKITSNEVIITDLRCDHEEADFKIFVYIKS